MFSIRIKRDKEEERKRIEDAAVKILEPVDPLTGQWEKIVLCQVDRIIFFLYYIPCHSLSNSQQALI